MTTESKMSSSKMSSSSLSSETSSSALKKKEAKGKSDKAHIRPATTQKGNRDGSLDFDLAERRTFVPYVYKPTEFVNMTGRVADELETLDNGEELLFTKRAQPYSNVNRQDNHLYLEPNWLAYYNPNKSGKANEKAKEWYDAARAHDDADKIKLRC